MKKHYWKFESFDFTQTTTRVQFYNSIEIKKMFSFSFRKHFEKKKGESLLCFDYLLVGQVDYSPLFSMSDSQLGHAS